MLGPIGSEIMRLFRLLSPEEIDKYILRENGQEIKSSMKMAANGESMDYAGQNSPEQRQESAFPRDHQAKIIPLHENLDKKESHPPISHDDEKAPDSVPSEFRVNKKVRAAKVSAYNDQGSGLESIGVLSAKQIRELEEERLRKENQSKDSSTVFLLKERQKMRSSKKRLIEQQALKQYQTNAAQEFHEEVFDDDTGEIASPDLKGILLNKKHY